MVDKGVEGGGGGGKMAQNRLTSTVNEISFSSSHPPIMKIV